MPDYHKPDLNAQAIPSKPRTYDEAAQSVEKSNQAAIERNRSEGRDHNAKQQTQETQNREAAGRRAGRTEKPGPAERMYGQDRFLQDHGNPKERSVPRTEMTSAQREMQAKREVAREQDRQVAAGKRAPEKQYGELQPKQNHGPSR